MRVVADGVEEAGALMMLMLRTTMIAGCGRADGLRTQGRWKMREEARERAREETKGGSRQTQEQICNTVMGVDIELLCVCNSVSACVRLDLRLLKGARSRPCCDAMREVTRDATMRLYAHT